LELDNLSKIKNASDMLSYSKKVRSLTNGKGLKVFVYTLGCQQNEADSETILGIAKSLGYEETTDETIADLIIVNTCAIREHAERRALSIIGRYKHNKERNPDTIIGVCGCMPSQNHRMEQLKHSYHYVNFVFGTSNLERLPEFIYNALTGGKRQFVPNEVKPPVHESLPMARKSKFKAWVSIMYGCNNFCTYCIVPYVRGRERSRMPSDVLSEIKDLVHNGYKEITLLGQNVNSYGKDFDFDYDIADLLKEISEIDGDFIIHLMTSHPKDATPKLIEAICTLPHMANHFHLPLQSGSDEILKRMNRHYTIEKYMDIIRQIKNLSPDMDLTTDIIVGFPNESDEDFEKTLEIVKEVRFDSIYTFIFSPRKGTPAFSMDNQIPEELKQNRFEKLNEVQNEISKEKNESLLGKTIRVLVEGKSKTNENVFASRTEGNKIVHFESDNDYTGQFKDIKITKADTFALYGEIREE